MVFSGYMPSSRGNTESYPLSHQGSPYKHLVFLFYLFMYLCMYVCMAELGLCCCTWAFSSCGEWGLLFIMVCGLLIVVASFAEHGL